jgi:hypothetical protein
MNSRKEAQRGEAATKGFNRQDAKAPRRIISQIPSWRLGVLAVQNLVGKQDSSGV